jgi:hypothetical protein
MREAGQGIAGAGESDGFQAGWASLHKKQGINGLPEEGTGGFQRA